MLRVALLSEVLWSVGAPSLMTLAALSRVLRPTCVIVQRCKSPEVQQHYRNCNADLIYIAMSACMLPCKCIEQRLAAGALRAARPPAFKRYINYAVSLPAYMTIRTVSSVVDGMYCIVLQVRNFLNR